MNENNEIPGMLLTIGYSIPYTVCSLAVPQEFRTAAVHSSHRYTHASAHIKSIHTHTHVDQRRLYFYIESSRRSLLGYVGITLMPTRLLSGVFLQTLSDFRLNFHPSLPPPAPTPLAERLITPVRPLNSARIVAIYARHDSTLRFRMEFR